MMSVVRELPAKVQDSEPRRITVISNALFVAGLVMIAVLMPLGRLPNPPVPYVSIVLLPLLFQRMALMIWDAYRKQGGGWPNLRTAGAFALPVVASIAATITAFNVSVALAAAILLFSVLLRGWVLS